MGIILLKMKLNHEAEAEFRAVIEESFKEIVDVQVYQWVWRAYERLSSLYYECLCFKTAYEFLGKAKEIVERHYEPDSYEFLDFSKKLMLYYKKFQKNEIALNILRKTLKTEMEIAEREGVDIGYIKESI